MGKMAVEASQFGQFGDVYRWALQWEAEHPACNVDTQTLLHAIKSIWPIAKRECSWEELVTAFYEALGQEPPEDPRDKRIAELQASFRIATEQRDNAYKERDEAREEADRLRDVRSGLVGRVCDLESEVARLRRQRDEARAEVERLKARIAKQKAALEAQSANVAQPIPDEAATAIARAVLCAAAEVPDHRLEDDGWRDWRDRGISAALAEARGRRPHGSWVPVKIGDVVRDPGYHQPLGTVEKIAVWLDNGNWRSADTVRVVQPLPPEAEEKCPMGHTYLAFKGDKFCRECGVKLTDPAGGEKVRVGGE